MDFKQREGRVKAAFNLVSKDIRNVVCIGGDGSLTGANEFREEWSSLLDTLVTDGQCANKECLGECVYCGSFF